MKFTAFKTIHALLLSQTASAALGEIITTIDRNGEQIVMMTDDGANDIARSPPSIADITDSSTAVIVDIPVCENDVDFIIPFKGEPKSCQDIGMDDTVRRELCKYETVTSHCPNICGVCCLDNSDFFFPGELTGDPRTCAWITKNVKKTEVRRENHCESKINGAVVKDQCQISCDFCFEPVQTCFNDADFLSQEFEGRERSCKNIRLDESRRNTLCQFDDVRKACPQSCGFCCVSDATYRFKSVDKKKRTCKWISRRNTAARRFKYCKKFLNGATVRDKCPEACDFCFDPVVQSQSPSSTPSKTPQRNTKSPTPVPTKGPTKAPVPAPVRPPVLAPVLPAPVPLPSSNPSVSIVPSLSMTPSVYPSDLPSVSLNPSSAPSDLPSTSANPSACLPCSCSPLVYNWTLSLNSECPETLPANDGLGSNSICQILTTTLDPVVRVSALRFYEYGSDLSDLVTFRFYSGNWTEGDSMSAESITKTEPDVFSSSAGFELTGYTAAGKDVAFQWLVDHTNACGEDPYQNIKSIGWMKFADQVPASDDTCAPCEAKSSKSGKSWSYPNKSSKSSKSAKCKKTVYKVKSAKDSKEAKSSRSKGGYRRK